MTRYYKQTNVSTSRSQESIERFLRHFGILETRFTNLPDQIIFEFNYPVIQKEKKIKLGVRMIIRLPDSKDPDQTRRQYYRILYHRLKSKFIDIEAGVVEFAPEFLGDLLYSLPNGKQVRVIELIAPQLEKNLLGDRSELLMLPEPE